MAGRSAATAAATPTGQVALTLIVGEEGLLVERAVEAARLGPAAPGPAAPGPAALGSAVPDPTVPGANVGDPAGDADVHDVRGADLTAGELAMLTSPSLFGGEQIVIVRAAHEASAAVAAELGQLAAQLPPDVTLIVTHSGGAKNKSL